jgi:hypothetical protein
MDSHENVPYRYWPDGLTESDIDALMAEAGISVDQASLDLVEPPWLDEAPSVPIGASELDPPAAGNEAA